MTGLPGVGALVFFFFQAEDGIRDLTVTGVQTCALPIFVTVTARRSTFPSRNTHTMSFPSECCTRSEEHTSELQSQSNLVCRLLLEKKKQNNPKMTHDLPSVKPHR